jgi:hypothetical protein
MSLTCLDCCALHLTTSEPRQLLDTYITYFTRSITAKRQIAAGSRQLRCTHPFRAGRQRKLEDGAVDWYFKGFIQGSDALGAFECGVVKALDKAHV